MSINKTLYELPELLRKNGGPIPMSRAGIYAAVKKGVIPSVRVGKRVFVPSWYVDSLLNEACTQGA
ncbi:hypothetical protein [Sporomusa sphaeroides]|uniref:Helix-turn-helix domain-containing protein n=1 Tax=Sporomusa sphaeroides DSM 2875 TaxID=1337886 RepID=A0ABP2C1R7_9FIRM|nr:hypothetical protein [Sporomusa sphaeroides]OLS56307.1 hypothetical protein SPSPH_27000 [Sporomusa sphaeroides DSM 2875]CVK18402.1 hypothetical protein SSPH_01040 [Sporomusa sphaeroides DSM 2875]